MDDCQDIDTLALRGLFDRFIMTGLTGKIDEFISLFEEPYTGVGLGEQGIVSGVPQMERIMRESYKYSNLKIETDIRDFIINYMSEDAVILSGGVRIISTDDSGESLRSGVMQTIGARRRGGQWKVCFTHASPMILTEESIEAYPIKFIDHTLSMLKTQLKTDAFLCAEINLTKNTIERLEQKSDKLAKIHASATLEELILSGMYGRMDADIRDEYFRFFDRLRLLGLFNEGVADDHFDYCLYVGEEPIWLRATVSMRVARYSGDVLAILSYSNLDMREMEMEQLSRKAYQDALTGILNRDGINRCAAEVFAQYDPNKCTALFIIDLDDFKQVNDRLGHQTGDLVLRRVADVLKETFRQTDAVGRVGGDEFMVLLSNNFNVAFLEKKANTLLSAMKLQAGTNRQLPISVSIGIAFGHAHTTFDTLYKIADIALYAAKKAGKCRFHMINADTNAEQACSGKGADTNLVSLQSLLWYVDQGKAVTSKTPYEALIENMPGGVIVISLTDRIRLTHCNNWASNFGGYGKEELDVIQKDNALALVYLDDMPLIALALEQMREGREKIDVTYRIVMKNGACKYIRLNASITTRNNDEIIYYGIQTDVDEFMRLTKKETL